MPADSPLKMFAACLPGVEPFLSQELMELGLVKPEIGKKDLGYQLGEGGITFTGSLEKLYKANIWLRTANRVLLRLASFHTIKFVELRRKTANLPWEQYLVTGKPIAIKVTCKHSKLYHSDAVAERVLGAIADRMKKAPAVMDFDDDQPSPQLVMVRLDHDICTISLDSSGEGLHRRGYRQALAKAPLRETLAAAILIASGWDKKSPLVDPFCGSGVIPIEAAMMASQTAPGLSRSFAFMNWPSHQQKSFEQLIKEARGKIQNSAGLISGSDRDAGAIKAAEQNARRAGVLNKVEFTQAAVSSIQSPTGPGWVVTNPPYGIRISATRDLRNLYTQFGNLLRERFPGWYAAYLCNDDRLASLTRLEFDKGVSLSNGGIPVKLTRARVPLE